MSEKGTRGLFQLFKSTEDDDDYELQEEYDLDDDITPLPKYQSSNRVVNLGQGDSNAVG